MTSLTPHRSVVVLKLPRPVPALVTLAQAIVQAMTGNASFPTPEPALATVTAAVTSLESAEVASKARTKGATAVRDDQRTALVTLLDQLKAYVQKIADANVETAAAIIESAGMAVRKTPVRSKRVFAVKQASVSGAAVLTVPRAAARASYEWEYGIDGKTWQLATATLKAKTTIAGLTPATMYYFRYCAVTKAGVSDWSQVVSLVVR
jgi:hypothetical protein